MHIGERITQLRNLRNLSRPELADKAGVDRSNLYRIEKEGKGFSVESLERIAKALGTTSAALIDERADVVKIATNPIYFVAEEGDYDPETSVVVPIVDVEISGGPGAPVPEFVDTRKTVNFQLSWVRGLRAKPEDLKILTVQGSSMEPTLFDGDKIVVHIGQKRIMSGRVFAIAYGNEARVKRLWLQPDGTLKVTSDNVDKHRFPDEFISGEDLNNVTIIGRVRHRMGEGGL